MDRQNVIYAYPTQPGNGFRPERIYRFARVPGSDHTYSVYVDGQVLCETYPFEDSSEHLQGGRFVEVDPFVLFEQGTPLTCSPWLVRLYYEGRLVEVPTSEYLDGGYRATHDA